MSTYYRPTKPISLEDIKKNKSLKLRGFKIVNDEDGQYFFCKSYLHFATDINNNVIDLFRYNTNNANDVLEPLSKEFGVDFISEYEDEYESLASDETPVMTLNLSDLLATKDQK